MTNNKYTPTISSVKAAAELLEEILEPTPIRKSRTLSDKFGANIILKQENLQRVRSYKIRGAYNKIKSLTSAELKNGIVCASAGNHAQGVAFSCNKLQVMGYIYMPVTTPRQKIDQVRNFGKNYVDLIFVGDTFDEANTAAKEYAYKNEKTFIPPFDDPKIIEGQGTVGLELMNQIKEKIDYVFVPIGGGGLAAGVGSYIKQISPETKIIGVEPAGAACMKKAFENGKVVVLDKIDKFVDGAAVKEAGHLTYEICKDVLDDIITIPEGAVCTSIIELYNSSGIVVEPAGALATTALRFFNGDIKDKNIVCIISGGNNDIMRMEEIREKSLIYEGLKHYFLVNFVQKPGALLSFIRDVITPSNNLVYFHYIKKTNKEEGPAIIGIEVAEREDYISLVNRMNANNISFQYINENDQLYEVLI